jgi:two-component system chemotaxis sensor kinase CheA
LDDQRADPTSERGRLPRKAGGASPGPISPLEVDKELLAIFVGEALDHLGSIETSVLALEETPDDQKALGEVFRLFHTIKGNAAALGFRPIEELAHTVEDLLDRARAGEHHIVAGEVEVVLAAIDLLTHMVRDVEERGAAGGTDFSEPQAAIKAAIAQALNGNPGTGADGMGGAAANAAGDGPAGEAGGSGSEPAPWRHRFAGSVRTQPTIKVDTRKLDNLVDLVGELVIVQSMIHQDSHMLGDGDERLSRNLSQFQRLTNELHQGAIAMRLVPIRHTFQRMQRLVRDLGRKSGKAVDLVLSGEDTELDRKVVEEIADPLMHMLRNSVDHGIEDAETRSRAGKPLRGQIALSASHEGGNVIISVADDGRGLDNDALHARGAAVGLIEPGAKPSEAELHALIFRSGFSTAREVTEMSGRGIGMDIVRRNVELLRGRIEIRSRPGVGTTFFIKLPLTLATIEGLLLGVAGQRFVLPTFSVQESLRPSTDRLHSMSNGRWLVEVRNELVPVVRLADLFAIRGAMTDPTEAALVVIEDDGRHLAIMIDQLIGKQNVVIKSLGEAFTSVAGVAGGAILADGRVGLILDAGGLLRLRARELPTQAA